MAVKCIIIEDEPLAQQKLAAYIRTIPDLELVAAFENSLEALVYIKTNDIGMVFLDIQVAGLNGIQLLESVPIDAAVILTTAHHEYALKGYELNVTDYLLKPFSKERLQQAVQKGLQRIEQKKTVKEEAFFFVKSGHKLERVNYSELLYIEGVRDYRKLHTITKQIMTLETFREFESSLSKEKMARVHKSYMVNIDKIESVERHEIKIHNTNIPISESYREEFYKKFKRGNF
ncbi:MULTISPECIES: LytR/AlgR family response regulator transcription factor [unclassified Paraflavitalea]|uniref:LytR/AlgR family response regulator transcription factor n=1 Tax=unclassified Paraflavitalea TaxID=2798305 RepID=UPI003D331DF0